MYIPGQSKLAQNVCPRQAQGKLQDVLEPLGLLCVPF